MWTWFKKIILAIWNWLVNFFHPSKKPTVRITIMLMLFTLISIFILPINSHSQRTELESIVVYFIQPNIENNSFWTIHWSSDVTEYIDVYKNDTLRVKIQNEEGVWVNWIELSNELDTMLVNIRVDKPYSYDTEFTFNVIARDTTGVESDPSEFISVYFMASDINKIIDYDVERGYIRGDYSVDGLDLIQLKKSWGKTGLGTSELDDITGDGNIDGLDLIQLKRDWGRTHFP